LNIVTFVFLHITNLRLIEMEDGDSCGISRCFLHRKRSGRCMSWRPHRQQVVVTQLVCDEASVAMQEQMFFARRGGWSHARGKRPSGMEINLY